ncbi:hypothetical protein AKJ08_2328 [Vulgatibacter incomptus]|uniref:Uncharacterized protein n=1 Tax=Vulgatibacter incomptus TaxID=1391653 RepID=A0A0K1PEV0_9BACT|nr:hypothetical protein AKJ08_2328 [Vulgatibacter incomptus]
MTEHAGLIESEASETPTLETAGTAEDEVASDLAAATKPVPDGRKSRWAWVDRARRIGAPVTIAAATVGFGFFVDDHYRVKDWLFWIFAQAWSLSLVFALACLSTGFVLTRWITGRPLRTAERLTFAIPLGVFAFFLAIFFLGLVGALGPVTFALLPLAMIAVGARPLARHGKRWLRHRRAWRRRSAPFPAWGYLAWAIGLVVLGMAYFLILSPANISFDSRWKHLAIAEQYATQGFVGPFLEGWFPGTAPHLPSFLYAWAFLIEPLGGLFGQLSLAAHMEFVLFVTTLIGIGALVRRLVPGADPRLVWVVRFLFPGMLLYDSNLSVGTDHIAAIFSIPVFLATLRAWKRLDVRSSVLLAAMIAGAILSKYSSAFAILVFPVLAIAFRALVLAVRAARGRSPKWAWIAGPLACVVAGLVFTAPHWLKNWIWYGSPIYPAGSEYFAMRPWFDGAGDVFRYGNLGQVWQPSKNWAGVLESLKVLFTFSFLPHDWGEFHGRVPVFGSLLTLTLLCLPFVRASRWLVALFASIHLGILTWFWIHHQDRHLQTLMPLMAAATASVMVLLWRQGRAARAALLTAIALQLVWGGDVFFFPTHNMAKKPIEASADLLASGYTKKPEQRVRTFGDISELRKRLPKGAKALLHDIHLHTGIGAPSVSDFQGWQGGISYGQLLDPGAIWDKLEELGVTHLVWRAGTSRGWDTLAGDIAFWNFAQRFTSGTRAGSFTVAKMPRERPEEPAPEDVVVLGCGQKYRTGLYRLEDLRVPAFGPGDPGWPAPRVEARGDELRELVERASFVAIENDCGSIPAEMRRSFELSATRRRRERIPLARDSQKDQWAIWRRVRPNPPPPRPLPTQGELAEPSGMPSPAQGGVVPLLPRTAGRE